MHLRQHALLAAALLFSAGLAAGPEVGKPAPDFQAVDTAGNTHAPSDFSGRTLVLEWTNHDCPFVRKHYDAGNMQAQQREATAQGVVWLSVISSAPGKQGHVSALEADALTETRGAAPSAVLLDPEGIVGRAYDARVTPHLYVIDPDGLLVYMGGIDSIPSADPADIPRATPYLANALDAVLTGNPVSDAVTRPYGCTVKY
jgi:peroxiredoxin